MSKLIEKLVSAMRANPRGVAYADARRVAEHFFGEGRQSGGSHLVFKMPWAGDPRINLQNSRGEAKAYQVRQILAAIDKLQASRSLEAEPDLERKEATEGKRKGND